MSDRPDDPPEDTPLNPALKSSRETVYDTTSRTPAPYDTASARAGEGESWPWVWLIVTLGGIALAVYLIL